MLKHFINPRSLIVMMLLLLVSTPAAAMQQSADDYDAIAEDVAELRGLELLEPIELTPLTREQLGDELVVDLEEDYPEAERMADARELIAFGLMDEDLDLGEFIVELYTEQIAGYYDPETSEMVVVRDGETGGALEPTEHVTFAHEVVHALQDQHFDLDAGRFDREDLTDDETLAVTALIEGDATFTEIEYLIERPVLLEQFLVELDSTEFDSDTLDAAPPLISATLLFPYELGFIFIEYLYEEGGWDAVNAAFADPPRSTEQILHPEKYRAGEEPVIIDVADFTSVLGDDWTLWDDNSFGEYQIRIILQQSSMPDEQAEEAAAGWGGDTYIVAGTDTEDAIHWVSVWETEEDARQFAQAYATYESDRWGVTPAYAENSVLRFEAEGVVSEIRLDGTTVTYLMAPDMATLETIAETDVTLGATPAATPAATPVATPAG